MGSNPKYIKSPGDYNKYTDYTFAEFWKQNRKNYKFKVGKAIEVMRKFAQLVHQEVLDNTEGFKLPGRIGTLMMSGSEGQAKDSNRSNKDKTVYHRNVQTNQVIYKVVYMFGSGRGETKTSIVWKFKSTTPLRNAIKQRIDQDKFRHWIVVNYPRDIFRYGINPEIPRN